jgi:hypothetical protein
MDQYLLANVIPSIGSGNHKSEVMILCAQGQTQTPRFSNLILDLDHMISQQVEHLLQRALNCFVVPPNDLA